MSFISVKAETPEYSLTEGDYVRILGRGEESNGRTFNWLDQALNLIFREALRRCLLMNPSMMKDCMKEVIS